MALKTVDLTQQPLRAVFTGCTQEDVNYAKTFWQSLQLLPPMESRLVSSDIKQRLRKAPPSRSQSECVKQDHSSLNSSSTSLHMTFSNSSCFLADSLNIYKSVLSPSHSEIKKSRTDSMKTQTSMVSNFGEDERGEENAHGRDYYDEPNISSISDQVPAEAVQGAGVGSKGGRWPGGGGRRAKESRSSGGGGKGDVTAHQLAKNIIPFSGEDLCQRKGQVSWGEQIMSTQAGADFMECGGEDLRWGRDGASSVQSKARSVPLQHRALLVMDTGRGLYPRPPSLGAPRRNKKLQRVVRTQKWGGESCAEEMSLFRSHNIDLQQQQRRKSSSPAKTLPEAFTKAVVSPEERDSASRQEKLSNKPELSSDKGGSDGSQAGTTGSPGEPGNCETVAMSPEQLTGDDVDSEIVRNPRLADKPYMLHCPSKDIVYWTF